MSLVTNSTGTGNDSPSPEKYSVRTSMAAMTIQKMMMPDTSVR